MVWHRPERPQTIGQVDVDTPVVDLGYTEDCGRDALVLLSDEERDRLSWVLKRTERYRELLETREATRRWHDQLWARATAVMLGLAALGSMVADWVFRAGGR